MRPRRPDRTRTDPALEPDCFSRKIDPDAAWERYGRYLLHDARMYAAWMGEGHNSMSKSTALDVSSRPIAAQRQGPDTRIDEEAGA